MTVRRIISVSPTSMGRGGRKLSRLSMLLSLCIIFIAGFIILSFVSNNNGRLMRSHLMMLRQAELTTWRRNQSVNVQDYLDPSNINSFIWQPMEAKTSVNDVSIYCDRKNVKVLAMVISAPGNFDARAAIRETWGLKEHLTMRGIRLVFVLGWSGNEAIEDLIAKEAADYGDIVEEDFLDSYHNLTLKSIAMLKWINLTCSGEMTKPPGSYPHYVLKVDDDIFINVERLLKIIHDAADAQMIGRLTCGASPVSDVNSKFYMPKYLYSSLQYPGYLSGTAYLLRGDIVPILLENVLTTPLIHLEDIYITALIARKSNIFPQDSPYFTFNRINPKTRCAFKFLVSSHQIKPNEMHAIWTTLKKPMNCSTLPKKHSWLRKVPRMTKNLKALCMFK